MAASTQPAGNRGTGRPRRLSLPAGLVSIGAALALLQERTVAESESPVRSAVSAELFLGSVRPDQIEADIDECRARGKPWSSYHQPVEFPDLIIFPESTGDVSTALKVCHAHRIPVVALAGGTSLEGQIMAPTGGVCMDFSRMKSVLEVNEKDLDCTVQPGLGYLELNDALAPRGVWFPLDPGPGAAIGGMCSCRCSGSTAVRYGSMRDNVLSLTVVLADGTVVKTGGKARKSSAGRIFLSYRA